MVLSNTEIRISSKKAKSQLFKLPDLPEEIVEHILVWLHVPSILRLKCVCKSWHSMISSKHFVQAHLRISKEYNNFHKRRLFFVEWRTSKYWRNSKYWETYFKHCSFLSLLSGTVNVVVDSGIPMRNTSYIYTVGECNGLICVGFYENYFYLCNPSTRDTKELPGFCSGIAWMFNIVMCGFGFDDTNEDYKVVCVIREDHRYHVAKVYSLKSNSWKQIEMLEEYVTEQTKGILVNQKLHWINEIIRDNKYEIVSFDLVKEIWEKMEIPNFYGQGCRCYKLFRFGGSLSLLCLSPQGQGEGRGREVHVHAWVLNEYENSQSWKKLLRIPHLEKRLWLQVQQREYELDNGPSGTLVLLDHFTHDLIIYDLRDDSYTRREEMDMYSIYGNPDNEDQGEYESLFFIESLVPLSDEVNPGL